MSNRFSASMRIVVYHVSASLRRQIQELSLISLRFLTRTRFLIRSQKTCISRKYVSLSICFTRSLINMNLSSYNESKKLSFVEFHLLRLFLFFDSVSDLSDKLWDLLESTDSDDKSSWVIVSITRVSMIVFWASINVVMISERDEETFARDVSSMKLIKDLNFTDSIVSDLNVNAKVIRERWVFWNLII